MTPVPLQLDLSLQLPAARPLIPMKAAMVLLDKGEDDVLALIENGHLAWAWDVRSREAERREVRIWRDCLLHHLHGLPQPDAEEHSILFSLFMHMGAEIKSTQLQRLFTASQGHVQNLIDQGLLRGLNQSAAGPNGFVRVTRESCIHFLRQRRVV